MRSIITPKDVARNQIRFTANEPSAGFEKPDNFIERVLKYVPSETVAAYIVIQKTIEQFQDKIPATLSFAVVIVMFIGNIFYLKKAQKVQRWSQVLLTSVAFVIWAYTLGEPFKHLLNTFYQPCYSSIGIVLFAFIVPIFNIDGF